MSVLKKRTVTCSGCKTAGHNIATCHKKLKSGTYFRKSTTKLSTMPNKNLQILPPPTGAVPQPSTFENRNIYTEQVLTIMWKLKYSSRPKISGINTTSVALTDAIYFIDFFVETEGSMGGVASNEEWRKFFRKLTPHTRFDIIKMVSKTPIGHFQKNVATKLTTVLSEEAKGKEQEILAKTEWLPREVFIKLAKGNYKKVHTTLCHNSSTPEEALTLAWEKLSTKKKMETAETLVRNKNTPSSILEECQYIKDSLYSFSSQTPFYIWPELYGHPQISEKFLQDRYQKVIEKKPGRKDSTYANYLNHVLSIVSSEKFTQTGKVVDALINQGLLERIFENGNIPPASQSFYNTRIFNVLNSKPFSEDEVSEISDFVTNHYSKFPRLTATLLRTLTSQ